MFKLIHGQLLPFYAYILFWTTLKGEWVKGITFPKVLQISQKCSFQQTYCLI